MNDIRVSKEKEVVIAKAKFREPIWKLVLISVVSAFFLILAIIGTCSDVGAWNYVALFSWILLIVCLPTLISAIVRHVNLQSCIVIVTNKRIYGTHLSGLAKKDYSYRLDTIENVEIESSLGVHTLKLVFFSGNKDNASTAGKNMNGLSANAGAGNFFKLEYISSYDIHDLYKKLSEQIARVKNDKDLAADIEMAKIEAENKKAEAFMAMAQSMTGAKSSNNNSSTQTSKPAEKDYVEQLRDLKQLLDEGIITQEEFDAKKAQILQLSK